MKEESVMSSAALSVNVLTVNVLVAVFFLSGVSADCEKNPSLFITAPKKIEALSGSCLQISCNFRAREGKGFDSSREITGVWIKNDPTFHSDKRNVVFNSSKQDNIYPIIITGNMREKDCTTLFDNLQKNHSGRYYFRMENGPFKSTASCDGVTITVKDSPWRPTTNISCDLENERVTITCSAVTPCPHSPPELTWNLQQDSHTQTEKNKDGTFTTKIQKIITLSDTHDGYTISCSVRYPVDGGKLFKTSQTEVTLRISSVLPDDLTSTATNQVVYVLLGGTFVTVVCLLVYVWKLKTHQNQPKTRKPAGETLQMPDSNTGEECLYEDMNRFKTRPKPAAVSVLVSGRQRETVDTQDQVSEPGNRSTQTPGSTDALYAQVRKQSCVV